MAPGVRLCLFSDSTVAPTSEIRETHFFKNQNFLEPKKSIGGRLTNQAAVDAEYQRLLLLVKDVDDTKKQLLDELLHKAAFLKVKMDILEEKMKRGGVTQKSSKGNVRISQRFKTYLASLQAYQQVIKTINTIAGKNKIDDDDEFDEFMRSIKGEQ